MSLTFETPLLETWQTLWASHGNPTVPGLSSKSAKDRRPHLKRHKIKPPKFKVNLSAYLKINTLQRKTPASLQCTSKYVQYKLKTTRH